MCVYTLRCHWEHDFSIHIQSCSIVTYHLIISCPRVVNRWPGGSIQTEGDGHFPRAVLIIESLPTSLVRGANSDGVDAGDVAISSAGVIQLSSVP